MKRKINYKEQYLSPKWQKKRLEILSRDNFTCQMCGDTESTLHVHHTIYIPGKDIWDYDGIQLITLCDKCHEEEHKNEEYINCISNAINNARHNGLTNFELWCLFRYFNDGDGESLIRTELKELTSFIEVMPDASGYVEIVNKLQRLLKRRDKYWNDLYC